MSHIVILGGGTAGTLMANRLRHRLAKDVRDARTTITIIDQDDVHVYQPGLLFVPFGIYRPEDILRPRHRQLHEDIEYRQGEIDRILTKENIVLLADGTRVPYDVLIVASGTRLAPEETEGLMGEGWRERVFDFYTLEGARSLGERLATWEGGRLVINIVEMPIKCPVAPLEFAFLADWFFTKRGMRDKVEISYVTPLDGAFTKPTCSRVLGHLLDDKRVSLVTDFNTGFVDGANGVLRSWDEREVPFDLLVTVPLHQGAEFVRRTPSLGDDSGFVRTDPRTLQSLCAPNVFAIGDATNVPASKAGSVAHFEGEVLEENIVRFLKGDALEPEFDGHANCFIETGFDRALLIDFNYDTEPLPGKFPFPTIGPLKLLAQSKVNHLGKLAFKWIYWNVLLPGHDIPAVSAQMSMTGKMPNGITRSSATSTHA